MYHRGSEIALDYTESSITIRYSFESSEIMWGSQTELMPNSSNEPKYKKRHRQTAVSLFYGQSVNNALEQAQFKNVAKPMFSGRKRTGSHIYSTRKKTRHPKPWMSRLLII